MAQLTLASLGLKPEILIPIPDKVTGATKWKRKAQVQKLEYLPAQMYVRIEVKIFAFAMDENGDFAVDANGNHIWLSEIPAEDDQMIADNTTVISTHPDTKGQYLLKNVQDITPYLEYLSDKEWAYEGELFCIMAEVDPVLVNPLIRAKVVSKYIEPQPDPTPVIEEPVTEPETPTTDGTTTNP